MFANNLLYMPMDMLFPPNYLTEQSAERVLGSKRGVYSRKTWEEIDSTSLAIVGSVDSVLRRLEEAHKLLGFGKMVPFVQFGSLPADLTKRNIELFAEHVIPRFRGL